MICSGPSPGSSGCSQSAGLTIAAGFDARAEDAPAASGSGATLAIATWGGAYGQSQDVAYFEPFTAKTGVKIKTETYDGTVSAIKDKIGDSASPIDVVDLSAGALDTLCHDGLLETMEVSMLDPAPSGTSASDDFLAGGLTSCGVASVAWSAALAFDRHAFTKAKPSKIADLLDLKRFPGKRALPNGPRYTLELALLADGVEPGNVYQELGTTEGADRAFAALDKIKPEILWWDKAKEPISWLIEGKAAMAAGYSGRIFRAALGRAPAYRCVVGGPDLRSRSLGDPEGGQEQGRSKALHRLCHRAGTHGGASRADRLWADAQIGDRPRRQASQDRHRNEELPADRARQLPEGAEIR